MSDLCKSKTYVSVTVIKLSPCGTEDAWRASENFHSIHQSALTAL